MITLLVWVVLVIVACYALAAVAILPLLFFVRLHHFRFGLERKPVAVSSMNIEDTLKLYTAHHLKLTDLELEDVITLSREDWWEVPDDETLRQVVHIGWMYPDGVHTREQLRVLEPNQRDYDEPCPVRLRKR